MTLSDIPLTIRNELYPLMAATQNPVLHFIQRNAHSELILSLLAKTITDSGRELNKTTLAEVASVGYSVVHRTDLALYDTMPPRLHKFFQKIDPEIKWGAEYIRYKDAQLSLAKDALSDRAWPRLSVGDLQRKFDTWIEFREYVADTVMEFSKLFLINPAILQHYESGLTKNLPIVIRKRLEYFGVPVGSIVYLSELPVGVRSYSE